MTRLKNLACRECDGTMVRRRVRPRGESSGCSVLGIFILGIPAVLACGGLYPESLVWFVIGLLGLMLACTFSLRRPVWQCRRCGSIIERG